MSPKNPKKAKKKAKQKAKRARLYDELKGGQGHGGHPRKPVTGFSDLPMDIVREIFRYCDPPTALCLSFTCKGLYNMFDSGTISVRLIDEYERELYRLDGDSKMVIAESLTLNLLLWPKIKGVTWPWPWRPGAWQRQLLWSKLSRKEAQARQRVITIKFTGPPQPSRKERT